MVNKNNVMAGVFLIGGLLLAIGMGFWLGDASELLRSKATYTARFSLKIGTAGLQPGSDVRLAGQTIGKVVEVRPVVVEQNGARAAIAMDVEIAVDRDVVLFEDAYAELEAPLLGGVSSLNFGSVGSGAHAWDDAAGIANDANALLDEGETVRGRLAPGLLAQAGLDAEAIAKLNEIFENVRSATARVDAIAAEFERDAGPSAQSVRAILEDVEGVTARFEGPDGWAADVSASLADARTFIRRLGPATDTFDALLADSRIAVGGVRGILSDNRDTIARTLVNAEALTETVRFDTADRVHGLLDQGRLAAGTYRDLGDQLNVIVDREYPSVRRTIENVENATEQGQRAIAELRAQPWRVLAQPSESELRREPLYAAARDYAGAVSDLRRAGEALESVIARAREGSAPPSALDVAQIQQLRADLDGAVARYRDSEQLLLQRLAGEP